MSFNYFPLEGEKLKRRMIVWDGLKNRQTFGRAALFYFDRLPDEREIMKNILPLSEIPLGGSSCYSQRNVEWDNKIRSQIYDIYIRAYSQYQDDVYPAINIPREIYGQSQSIAEIFGCRLLPNCGQEGLYYPVPFIERPSDIDHIMIKPIKKSIYGKSIEFVEYATISVSGQLSIRNPVMTGPVDTANYLLGTKKLMEWVYDEPEALHRLLRIITNVLIEIIIKLQVAADGKLCPEVDYCLDEGFGLCSELRHLISVDVYCEFEAPYLKQIGDACGLYAIHSCGTWERTIPSIINDKNIMLINFQSREMDLKKVCEMAKGKVSISVKKSLDLDERYTWEDDASFYKYIVASVPDPLPIEVRVDDIGLYMKFLESYKTNRWRIFL